MQHKTWTAQQQGTLKERWDFTTAVLDIVHLWTFEILKCWTWFQTVHALSWLIYLMTLFFTGFVSFFKKGYCRALYWGNCCCKTNYALKIVWCTCVCEYCEHILLWTGLKRLSPKHFHRSFVGWTGGAQLPTTMANGPVEPAWGKTPLHLAASNGHVEAAELLLSKKAAVNIKTNDGPGPQSGKQRSNLGHCGGSLEDWNFGEKRCIFSNCLAKFGFPPLNIRQMQMLGSMISM